MTIEKAGDGDGTISSDGALACGATCSAADQAGDIVRLTADPDGNSVFMGWTGECTSTATKCNFPVDGEITVTATFEKKGNRLNVSRVGAGTAAGTITADVPGIDCGAVCSYTYPAGTVVTLTAAAQPGYLFAGWGTSSDCGSATGPTCVAHDECGQDRLRELREGRPGDGRRRRVDPRHRDERAGRHHLRCDVHVLLLPRTPSTDGDAANGPRVRHWSDCPPPIRATACDRLQGARRRTPPARSPRYYN